MVEYYQDGKCPFCDELPATSKPWIPELNSQHWRVKENDYPTQNAKQHILIVPRLHVLNPFTELYPEVLTELSFVLLQVKEFFDGLEGGGMLARFGNLRLSAGTVEHFHFNVIVPALTGEMRLPLAKEMDPASIKRRSDRFMTLVSQLPVDLQQLVRSNFPNYPYP